MTRKKALDYWGRLPHNRDVLDKFINKIYDSIGTCGECKHYEVREATPNMYCKLKREDSSGAIETTVAYHKVGSTVYETFKKTGWTECTHKTFEEIE